MTSVPFAIIRKKKLCRASKNRGKVGLITENKFQNCGKKNENDFQTENDRLRRNDYKMATTGGKISENGQNMAGIPDICAE
ncbi:hypothetical protein [Faecalibacterium prausnitzii]|uniref:hypothetical protein n=1 Tax=Faecalibacterium prausnitzii TaxID=853 RepID=UPI00290BE21A|nr:hypothetical protein [Faecalibacterium prausnitzii]MDU8667557.1 hypothetical protein [Faecalibacterium prausnitzii]